MMHGALHKYLHSPAVGKLLSGRFFSCCQTGKQSAVTFSRCMPHALSVPPVRAKPVPPEDQTSGLCPQPDLLSGRLAQERAKCSQGQCLQNTTLYIRHGRIAAASFGGTGAVRNNFAFCPDTALDLLGKA